MRIYFSLLFIFLSIPSPAQYHFDSYPNPGQKALKNWTTSLNGKGYRFRLALPGFFGDSAKAFFVIQQVQKDKGSYSLLQVYMGKRLIYTARSELFISMQTIRDVHVFSGDIDSDGLKDLKLTVPYYGCGIAALNHHIIYLFQDTDTRFTKITFDDKLEEENRPERDLDGDGNFEIITMEVVGIGGHNYWCFNLYNYSAGGFVNVSEKAGYPILVQLLYRPNYAITNKIGRENRKRFSRKLPLCYSRQLP